jgi:hypothetical protein
MISINLVISSGERGYTGPMMESLGTLTNIIHSMVDGSDTRAHFQLIQDTEYTQNGNGRFLAYILS